MYLWSYEWLSMVYRTDTIRYNYSNDELMILLKNLLFQNILLSYFPVVNLTDICSSLIVLKQGWFCPPWDIWQCLESFLYVMVGRGSALPAHCLKPDMLLDSLQCTGQSLTKKIIWSQTKILIVLRLRSLF